MRASAIAKRTSMFLRGLNVLSGLIDRAAESGLDEAAVMEARLAPDMKPFPDQIRMASFSARSCIARLTDQPWPKTDDAETAISPQHHERTSVRICRRSFGVARREFALRQRIQPQTGSEFNIDDERCTGA